MKAWTISALAITLASVALVPLDASAIPAFARKYETSCLTCHSIYPRLTPFGEAFRRNGYRFPGVDSDFVKQNTVVLGQEAAKKTFPNTVWPASIPISAPVAIGFNGQAFVYPDKKASVPRANTNAGESAPMFVLDDLVAEGHIWVGAALDDSITLWGELTFADGAAEVEHAQVLFNDLLGPKHAVNLVVGKGFPTLTSFGPHSTYLGDLRFTNAGVTGLFGVSPDSFVLADSFTGAEVTGVVGGRFDYSAGLSNGKNASTSGFRFNSENAYAHAGYKAGGMRLDGEGDKGPKDAMHPWAEDAVTVDAFIYHSREYFDTPGSPAPPPPVPATGDTSFTVGVTARAQLGSLELDLGAYGQKHDVGWIGPDGLPASVKSDVEWGELSYVVYPWLVPAIRVERIGLRPTGGSNVSDIHVMPGIAFLIRANIKAVLVANIEWARGFPTESDGVTPLAWSGGNADWGGFVASGDTSTATGHLNEFESIALFFAWAI